MATIDLEKLVETGSKYDLKASNESPEDAQARRMQEAAEHKQRLRQRATLFGVSLLFVVFVFFSCVYLFAAGAPEDKKWATGIISTIISGLIGYLLGGQAKK